MPTHLQPEFFRRLDDSDDELFYLAPRFVVHIDDDDNVRVSRTFRTAGHELFRQLKGTGRPGLVLFSSGSTGQSKAAVHDFGPLLEKFKVPRRRLRAMCFLLFDHIGGVIRTMRSPGSADSSGTTPSRRMIATKVLSRHRCATSERIGRACRTSPMWSI